MFLALDSLAGLPAHALLVHAAVILVPLAAITLLVTGWNDSWRKHYSLPVALLAIGGAVFAFLARESGGPLERAVRRAAETAGTRARFGDHPEQGDRAFVLAVLFAAAAVAFWAVDRYWTRWNLPSWSPRAAYAIALVPAALGLVSMIVAGHSGAHLVWKDVGSFAAGK